MTHPPRGRLAVLRCNLRLLVLGIGEESVKSGKRLRVYTIVVFSFVRTFAP